MKCTELWSLFKPKKKFFFLVNFNYIVTLQHDMNSTESFDGVCSDPKSSRKKNSNKRKCGKMQKIALIIRAQQNTEKKKTSDDLR